MLNCTRWWDHTILMYKSNGFPNNVHLKESRRTENNPITASLHLPALPLLATPSEGSQCTTSLPPIREPLPSNTKGNSNQSSEIRKARNHQTNCPSTILGRL